MLKDDGHICWQVGNYVENGEVIPLDILLYPIFSELKMKMRNRVIWHFGHGLHASKRFSGRHETAPSYMDAWLKTSTKNKKQLMINEAVIYSASKCHNGFCILPKILERFTQVSGI